MKKLRQLHTLTPRDKTIQVAVVVRDVSGQDIADASKVPFFKCADQAQRTPQVGGVSGCDFGNAMHEDTLPGGDETGMAHKAVKPSFEGRPENIHRFKRQVVEHFINQGVRTSGTTGTHAFARVQDGVQGEVDPHMSAALVLAGTLIFKVMKPQELLITCFKFGSEEVSVVFEDDLRPFSSVERSLAALIVHPRDAVLGALVGALHLKGRLSKAGLGDFSEPLPFSPIQDPRKAMLVARIAGFGKQDADLNDIVRFGETLFRGAVKDIRERCVMSSSDKASLEITDGGVTRKPTETTRKRTRISFGERSPAFSGLGPFQRAASVRVSVTAGGWRAEVGTVGSAG